MKALAILALSLALSGCGIFSIDDLSRRVDDYAAASDVSLAALDRRLQAMEASQDVQNRRITRNEQLAGAAFAAAARALEATEANREAMRRMFEESQRK